MNWLKKISGITYEGTYELRHDGKLIMRGSENDCYRKLQQSQSQSADWAMKYEGWTITPSGTDWRKEHKVHQKPEQTVDVKLQCGYCGNLQFVNKSDFMARGYPNCLKCNRDLLNEVS